jgi:hypothetical protein
LGWLKLAKAIKPKSEIYNNNDIIIIIIIIIIMDFFPARGRYFRVIFRIIFRVILKYNVRKYFENYYLFAKKEDKKKIING